MTSRLPSSLTISMGISNSPYINKMRIKSRSCASAFNVSGTGTVSSNGVGAGASAGVWTPESSEEAGFPGPFFKFSWSDLFNSMSRTDSPMPIICEQSWTNTERLMASGISAMLSTIPRINPAFFMGSLPTSSRSKAVLYRMKSFALSFTYSWISSLLCFLE